MTYIRPRSLRHNVRLVFIFCAIYGMFLLLPYYALPEVHARSVPAASGVTEREVDAVERRMDAIDVHLTATDKTVGDNSTAISRMSGIGIGMMGLLTVLEIVQIRMKARD